MRALGTLMGGLFIVSGIHAQIVGDAPGKGMDLQTQSSGFVTQLPVVTPEVTGDSYIESNWSSAEISLYSGTILEKYPVRLDLKNNALEISYKNQIKILSGVQVKNFSWLNSTTSQTEEFINAKTFTINNTPLTGFLKIIKEGSKWSLTSKTYVRLVEGAYVAALDAGDKKSKFVKDEVYFLAFNNTLYQGNLPKKKFIAQFNSDVQNFLTPLLKDKKLNPRSKVDLFSIHAYLDEYQKG